MGNVPVCNCLINTSKDKEGGNFYINELENEKEKKNNELNINNVLNPETSKAINQKENIENNKIDKNSKNNSSFNPNNNSSINKNNIINKNKVNKENKKKNTHDSSEITTDKDNNKKKENEDKENKKEKEEKKIENINIKQEEKEEIENKKVEKQIEKDEKKTKKKIEKSKFAKTIIICGPMESGKTSFAIRYCENKFDNCYIPSFMNEVSNKIFLLNNGEKILKIKFIVTNDLNDLDDVDCYFVFYDLNSNQSFIQAKKLVEEKLISENIHIFFIGNKSDLKCTVNKSEIEEFCNKLKIQYFYISVKNNIGISALMAKFSKLFQFDDD